MSTVVIGHNSATEVSATAFGSSTSPQNAGSCFAVQISASASATPDTAWIKISATHGSDLQLCVWDNSGNLLIQSNIITSGNINITSGVWNQLTLQTTAALTSGTNYWMGVQKSSVYTTIRTSSSTTEVYEFVAATWSTPVNPGNFSGSSSQQSTGLLALYFSLEAAGVTPVRWDQLGAMGVQVAQ